MLVEGPSTGFRLLDLVIYGHSRAALRNSVLVSTHFTAGGRTSILCGSYLGVIGSIVHPLLAFDPLLVFVGGFMVKQGGKLAVEDRCLSDHPHHRLLPWNMMR